jgi:nicotinate-nucleotide adenylyltransferase
MRAKRAIFGGTFNPVHSTHLEIALAAQSQFQLTEIIWVPTATPPYKPGVLAFEHRLAMVQGAIASQPAFTVAQLPQPFAIDILTTLQDQKPNSDWFWLIGLDAFMTLPRWVGRDKLAASCCWLVAPRTVAIETAQTQCQQVANQFQAAGIKLQWQRVQQLPSSISSSQIRQRCHANLPIDHLIPAAVQAYIEQHSLYRS